MAVKLLLEEDKIDFIIEEEEKIDFSKIEILNISCKEVYKDGSKGPEEIEIPNIKDILGDWNE